MRAEIRTDEAYQVNAVCCGDLFELETRHPHVCELLSRDQIETFARFPGAGDDFPQLFYLEQNGRICSYFRTIPDEITAGNKTHRWAWSADNFTYPEFRGRGLSTLLQQEGTSYLHRLGIGRGSVFSTDVTLHIFRKLGFTVVGYAKRYLLIRSAGPMLRAHIANPQWRRLVDGVSKPVATGVASGLRLWQGTLGNGRTTAHVSVAAASIDPLLNRLKTGLTPHFSRRASVLDEKISISRRTGTVTMDDIRARESGDSIAYMIVRERFQDQPLAEKYRGFRRMTLMDFAFVRQDRRAAAGIVGHLLRRFDKSDCEVLEIISNDHLVNRAARCRGMIPVGKGMSFAYSVPKEWNWPAEMSQLECWPLTHFCGDGFSF